MKDIAPELYTQIKEIFDRKYAQAQLFGGPISDTLAKINSGEATFRDADLFAVEVGSMMADAMKDVLVLDDLPGGRLYRNIAQKTIGEGLKDTYGIMSNISKTIQEEINSANGIGIKAVQPKLETDRVDRIVSKAAAAKTQDALDNMLTESVPTFTRQVVDDTQKANARLHNKAGLEVKVEREYDGVGLHDGTDTCDWCLERAGTWTYDKALTNGVFERHEGCGCIIEYTSRKGERTIGTGAYLGGDRNKNNGKTTTGWEWNKIDNPNKKEKEVIAAISNKGLGGISAGDKRDNYKTWDQTQVRKIKKGFSCFPNDEKGVKLKKRVEKTVPETNYYDVALHGNSQSVCFGTNNGNMSPRSLANYIVSREDYNGNPIRLLACETGKQIDGDYCFAEELANCLGVEVKAPEDILFFREDGSFYIGTYGDKDLRTYRPNERRRLK